jgi:hypothetical protein
MSEKQEQQFSIEEMKVRIAERVDKAIGNPIVASRLSELEKKLSEYDDKFIETGHRSADQIIEEDKIEAELVSHSALADNLVEFTEMVDQIGTKYSFDIGDVKKWAEDTVAHENAHANMSQVTGNDWVGYATLFYKNEDGGDPGFFPFVITKPKNEWGPKEVLTKDIERLNAPEMYGNKPSNSDVEDIAKTKEKLKKLEEREKQDAGRIASLKGELGI